MSPCAKMQQKHKRAKPLLFSAISLKIIFVHEKARMKMKNNKSNKRIINIVKQTQILMRILIRRCKKLAKK